MENRIREIRQSIGMTLQQVAERAGTTKAQVMKLEKGDRRLTDTWMVRLSLAMSCDPKELMGTIRDSRHLPEEETSINKLELRDPDFPNPELPDPEAPEPEIPVLELNDPEVNAPLLDDPEANEPELVNLLNPQVNSPAKTKGRTKVKSPAKTKATISSTAPSSVEDLPTKAVNLQGGLPQEQPKKVTTTPTVKNKSTVKNKTAKGLNITPIKQETISNVKGSTSTGSLRKARAPKAAAPGCDPVAEIAVRGGMGGGGEAAVSYSPDGSGGMAIADDVKGNWFLPSEYLRSELSVSPAAARIIEVQGDSMTPTLHSGDRVMIDTNDQRPSPPGIFALWDGIGVVVKRLEHVPNSDPALLRISSDNDKHCEYQRTFEEVNIIGRVIWYGRRV